MNEIRKVKDPKRSTIQRRSYVVGWRSERAEHCAKAAVSKSGRAMIVLRGER